MRKRSKQSTKGKQSPDRDAGAAGGGCVLVIIIGLAIYYYSRTDGTAKPQSFQDQMRVLEDTQADLDHLLEFVEQQKAKLREQEAIVARLQEEENQLRPVVDADRKTVEAVLAAEAGRRRERVWLERLITLLLGVAGSLFAQSLYRRWRRWRNTAEEPP